MASCDCGSRMNQTSIADCSCLNDAGGRNDNSIDLRECISTEDCIHS